MNGKDVTWENKDTLDDPDQFVTYFSLLLLLVCHAFAFCVKLLPQRLGHTPVHHVHGSHLADDFHLVGLHLSRRPQVSQSRVSGRAQTVDGAVGRGLQGVGVTVETVLQGL